MKRIYMKKYVFALAVLAMAIVSCTKEKSIDSTDPDSPTPGGGNSGGGNGGGGNSGSLLVRTVVQLGNDSSVTQYGYDAGKRLISQTVGGMTNPFLDEYDMRVTRNSQGLVERGVIKDRTFDDDSSIFKVNYDAAAKRYSSKVGYDGDMVKEDSTVFIYDAAGKLIRQDYYLTDGSAWEMVEKIEHTFDGAGNITKFVISEVDGNNSRPYSELRLTYDDKTNPLRLAGAEAFLLQKFMNNGTNNVKKIEVLDLEDPSNNETMEYRFTYNSGNRPTKADIMYPGIPVGIPMHYRYQ